MGNREWLLSNDFAEYRREEVKAGAVFFRNILMSPHNSDYLRGMADMLRAIIKIPKEIAQTEEEQQSAEAMVAVAFKEVEMTVYRSVLMGDE
jgi:ATP-dependent phosphoenolpyruvate carboxykinase